MYVSDEKSLLQAFFTTRDVGLPSEVVRKSDAQNLQTDNFGDWNTQRCFGDNVEISQGLREKKQMSNSACLLPSDG